MNRYCFAFPALGALKTNQDFMGIYFVQLLDFYDYVDCDDNDDFDASDDYDDCDEFEYFDDYDGTEPKQCNETLHWYET